MKTTATLLPEICNVLYYTFPAARRGALLLAMVLITGRVLGVDGPAAPGGDSGGEKPAVETKKDACCEAMAAAAFSKDSIYQLDAKFTDDSGRAFTLGELRGRPVVLNMFFASCGYACPLTVTDMQAIRGQLPAQVRDRTVFVLVSFDVARDTPAELASFRAKRGLGAEWKLLHGGDDEVRELAALLGVKYKQETDGMFSHSNLVTILNPQGEIVHQRTGLKGGLVEAAAALVAAAAP